MTFSAITSDIALSNGDSVVLDYFSQYFGTLVGGKIRRNRNRGLGYARSRRTNSTTTNEIAWVATRFGMKIKRGGNKT